VSPVSTPAEREPFGWGDLRHGGLLLDKHRLRVIARHEPDRPLSLRLEDELRRQVARVQDGTLKPGEFASFVLEQVCGFTTGLGTWRRGSDVGTEWTRTAVTGEAIRPRHLWRGDFDATLPVFVDTEAKLGIGRGTRLASHVLQWLRAGRERLALLTNGHQWRLIFAGLDFDAWCQWDIDLWFEDGELAPQVAALRTLLQPALWVPEKTAATPNLLQAVLDSRKGQAELSAVLGERVREAVELLVQAHGDALKDSCADVPPADIYRAAVRVVMRLVVILFAESREQLLPRDNAIYHGAYGLTGLREELDKLAARGGSRLKRSNSAWPRVLALFKLIFEGSHHADVAVPEYGGELFAAGSSTAEDGLTRALAVFESACFSHELLFPDADVHRMLELLTKTKIWIRQGRAATSMSAPVDFSDLSSEYIGILYEGLLDFELKTAPAGDPVIFLAVGSQPALPLSRLEAMDEKAIASLLEKMKDTSSGEAEEDEADAERAEEIEDEPDEDVAGDEESEAEAQDEEDVAAVSDDRGITRTRAEEWARRAVVVGKLAKKPRGTMTPAKEREWETKLATKAKQIVTKVVLPGESYLVRWGGTRKGSGTFYTRPGLAVPTVHRTLRPLAYEPPIDADGQPDLLAPAATWTPRRPEDILALKVCDPACGSGTFPVAALRFLTDALYASLHHHGRIAESTERSVIRLFEAPNGGQDLQVLPQESLSHDLLPCPPSDPTFEPRLKAILRRHVVERCIYGVDLDPLAVELCRLALWIETMDRDLPFSFLDHKVKCGNALVGAWFDTFQHYPVMAWKNREGGDKSHTNGVHFQKEVRSKAIKAFVREKLTPDLTTFVRVTLGRNAQLFGAQQSNAHEVHARALATLSALHALPVHAASERAEAYREQVTGAPEYQALRLAMDLWCACWFWPVDALDAAPLPTTFGDPGERTVEVARVVAKAKRFFHWELAFPDVFNRSRSGFDAILGNPPWDIAKPNSKEFFSNIDPLYRSYGKQDAIARQTGYFDVPAEEERWLDYNGDFRAQSNWVGYAAFPFGDPEEADKAGDKFAIGGGRAAAGAHDDWRAFRSRSSGFADRAHAFRHQGGADLNLYKLFLEQAHALLTPGGRLGFIVPSGLYSDHGTGDLRRLFLDQCEWEWLFGFENREKVFDIDSRFKFNPVIVRKGGRTRAIQTAFMRRRLEDWETAEALATPYTREQVDRFSPRSKAILEIQSARDLEILEKIYANSVLLGDDGPDGWGIRYATEFHMTNDSKLFPPRPKWEERGYRPDEYSRWLKGDWRPIEDLWRELGVDPSRVVPIDPACAQRVEAPDVQRTEWRVRCAQPPYDTLAIPRADIPPGIVLSRDADAWIRQEGIEDVALPLYEGRMIGQFDFSEKGWVSGKGRSAEWRDIEWSRKEIEPQYLMAFEVCREHGVLGLKLPLMNIGSATNSRTAISAVSRDFPCNHSLNPLRAPSDGRLLALATALNSFVLDAQVRVRLGGLNLSFFVLDEVAIVPPAPRAVDALARPAAGLSGGNVWFSNLWTSSTTTARIGAQMWRRSWALSHSDRLRLRAAADALVAGLAGLDLDDLRVILAGADLPAANLIGWPEGVSAKGFWRLDKDKDPELRHTVLTLVAFADLEEKIRAAGGDRDRGIEAFLEQNDGEGWMLPETLRLADYGLGHDDRAQHPQPVASRLGPRFYDWQLAQTAEESWRECEVHTKNLTAGQRVQATSSDATLSLSDARPRRTDVLDFMNPEAD
jgi:hypothetical protein